MTDTEAKKTAARTGLYLVSPEQKPGIKWPTRPKDALPGEGQYSYYARKFMEAQTDRSEPEASPIERELDTDEQEQAASKR